MFYSYVITIYVKITVENFNFPTTTLCCMQQVAIITFFFSFQANYAPAAQHHTIHHHARPRLLPRGGQRTPRPPNVRGAPQRPRWGHPDPELPKRVPRANKMPMGYRARHSERDHISVLYSAVYHQWFDVY